MHRAPGGPPSAFELPAWRLLRRLGVALAVAAASVTIPPAAALELHTFVDDGCALRSGVLIGIDDEQIDLIGLDGRPLRVAREAAAAVVIHKTLENPLSEVTPSGATRARLREIWVGSDRRPTFTGWPVGFFDDLILFLDTQGKTHALEREDVQRIRAPAARPPGPIRPAAHARVTLDFPGEIMPCPVQAAPGELRPSRVLSDRIKVGDYLAKLHERFLEVASFEERTRVYARPLMFDPTMRLGLAYFSKTENYVPLYFQWSNGKPYRFQSLTAIGRIQTPWVPRVEPSLAVRSDVKSHFFHAAFIGHVTSLSAGSSAFEIGRFLYGSPPGRAGELGSDELFNYIALLGADWERLSLGLGPYYRALWLEPRDRGPREIVAERASLAGRFMYTGDTLRLRAQYFRTRQEDAAGRGLRPQDGGGVHPDDPDDPAPAPTGPPAYRLALDTVRAGADATLWGKVDVTLDYLVTVGRHREAGGGLPPALIDLRLHTAALSARQAFGRYVAVVAYSNLRWRRHAQAGFAAQARFDTQLGGALEFLF